LLNLLLSIWKLDFFINDQLLKIKYYPYKSMG
jgi:hypothetical protein